MDDKIVTIRQEGHWQRQSHIPKRGRKIHPLYRLDHEFWPDRKQMCDEALSVRDKLDMYDAAKDATIKVHYMGDDTPLLNKMWQGWTDRYGSFGNPTVSYFYIDPGMQYGWHIDTNISHDMTSKGSILCAMNVVLTETHEAKTEFLGFEDIERYRAALFNTSWMHQVQIGHVQRILARITFRDVLYEELVYKIKKIDKQHAE